MKQQIILLVSAVGLAFALSLGLLLIPLAVIADSGSITHTTQAEFNQSCTVLAGTIPTPLLSNSYVSSLDGGAVILNAVFFDDFNGTTLNSSRWQTDNWSGSNVPLVNSSLLTVPTATFVRSTTSYTQGTMEAVAKFGLGEFQHLGLVENDGFSKYFMFSTYSTTDTLHARVFYGGSSFQAIPIPSITLTDTHNYRIEWAPNAEVRFYVDGTLVHTSSITTSLPLMRLYVSNDDSADDGISADLQVDKVHLAPPYVGSGSYTSCAFDAGAGNSWQTITWDAVVPASTNLTVQTRVSFDGSTWSGWGNVFSGGAIYSSTLARYVQYRLLPSTSNTQQTPIINSVTLNYDTLPPGVIVTESNNSTNVTEGGTTDTYRLWLTTGPSATVTINITTNGQVSVAPTVLNFTTANWNTPQTVTVTAVNDTVVEASPHAGVITHTAISTDANYNNLSVPGITVNVTDNDVFKVFLPVIMR